MIKTIEFKGESYPLFQSIGPSSRFAEPYAKELCIGIGYDIGCMKKEWALPGAIPIDIDFDNGYHALNLPQKNMDYIFSSHMLEHTSDWVRVLDYWATCLKIGGVLFLYLPHPDQRYWLPWHDKKHNHILYPKDITQYFTDSGSFKNIFNSERDLNHSFIVVGEKI